MQLKLALFIFEKTFGVNDLKTVQLINNVSIISRNQSWLSMTWTKVLGADNIDAANSISTYIGQCKYDDCKETKLRETKNGGSAGTVWTRFKAEIEQSCKLR